MESHADGNPSQPELITDALGKNFGLAKVVEDLLVLVEGVERIAQVQPQIDPLLEGFTTLGEMREGSERLLKAGNRFPVGRAHDSLRAGPTKVADGLVPDLAAEGMVGETIDPPGQPGGILLFDRRHDARVKGAPSVLEETRVSSLVAQGVLEREFRLRDDSRLAQELASLHANEAGAERFLR